MDMTVSAQGRFTEEILCDLRSLPSIMLITALSADAFHLCSLLFYYFCNVDEIQDLVCARKALYHGATFKSSFYTFSFVT